MTRRSWLLMGLLAALWGASYMFIKIALRDGVPAPSIVFIRVALGAALLSAIAVHQRAFGGLRGRRRWVVAIGVVQVAGPFLLITYGERWIPSALAGILVASAPIFVALLSPWLARSETVHGWAVAGIIVGIVGVALLFGVDLSASAKLALGGGLVLLAGLGYAFGAIWVRYKLPGAAPVGIAAGTMLAATALTLPLAITHPPAHAISAGAWAALLTLGAGGTGIAFLIYYVLIADVGANRATVVAYLAPGFSVLYGALFLGETITAATIAGLVLILAGSWIAAEGRPPWRARATAAVTAPATEVAFEPLAEDLVS
ncbi:MAG TPA: DMT family transporter [Solirubrobacteraceae bacterium]|nr:DMT family transporter [Solirubrobacteraceae bacterium]